jgi:hypothetical protein
MISTPHTHVFAPAQSLVKTRLRAFALFFAMIVVCGMTALTRPQTASAQDMEIPANLQAAIFKKVLGYVKISSPKVTIVFPSSGAAAKDAIQAQFKTLGIDCDAVDEASAGKASGNVVYLVPGTSAGAAKKCEKKFTITSSKDFVSDGLACMGIVNAGGKPQLLANMSSIGAAGVEVDPQLFRIAQQIRKAN